MCWILSLSLYICLYCLALLYQISSGEALVFDTKTKIIIVLTGSIVCIVNIIIDLINREKECKKNDKLHDKMIDIVDKKCRDTEGFYQESLRRAKEDIVDAIEKKHKDLDLKSVSTEEVEKMYDHLDNYMSGFTDSLLRKTRIESEARGEARGEVRGEARGEEKATRENIRSMQQNGLSAETIAQYLNKSVDVVKSLML